MPAMALPVAGILARAGGPVLWVSAPSDLSAPALAGFGLGPKRVPHLEADRNVLLAVEGSCAIPVLASSSANTPAVLT